MRYLRKQVINRRAPNDARLDVDINNNVIMSSPAAVQVPTGTTVQRPIVSNRYGTSTVGDLSGMIRYNVTTDQLEGYQAGAWRAFRFKESVGIIQQNLGVGDFSEIYFGPLDPAPPSVIDSNTEWSSHGTVDTPGNVWTGANLIVVIETVIQIFNTNFTIVQNPGGTSSPGGPHGGAPYPAGYYIKCDSPVPVGKPVFVLHGFDR